MKKILAIALLGLAFGTKALQMYAEIIDDGDSGYLFQTVTIYYYLKLILIALVQNGSFPYAN